MKLKFNVHLELEAELEEPSHSALDGDSRTAQLIRDFIEKFCGDQEALETFYRDYFVSRFTHDWVNRSALMADLDYREDVDIEDILFKKIAARCDDDVRLFIAGLFDIEGKETQDVITIEEQLEVIRFHFYPMSVVKASFTMADQ